MDMKTKIDIERIVTNVMLSHASDNPDGFNFKAWTRMIALQAASIAVAAEREDCAVECEKVADKQAGQFLQPPWAYAAAIRARGA